MTPFCTLRTLWTDVIVSGNQTAVCLQFSYAQHLSFKNSYKMDRDRKWHFTNVNPIADMTHRDDL